MLDCDRCRGWYHGNCVGVTKDKLPPIWLCDDCTLTCIVAEQNRAFADHRRTKRLIPDFPSQGAGGDDDVVTVDDDVIMRQIMLNHMTGLAHIGADVRYSRQFQLARWIEELELHHDDEAIHVSSVADKDKEDGKVRDAEFICAHLMEQWNEESTSPESGAQLSAEANGRVARTLVATSSGLLTSFPRLLGVLVKLMGDQHAPSLRKQSVKAISLVIQTDPMLMLNDTVGKAVAARFQDEGISVRESAVRLSVITSCSAPNLPTHSIQVC
ncbi:MAG: hypothetical protein ACREOZ_02555 [Gloeomargaritales cyanobacterium]